MIPLKKALKAKYHHVRLAGKKPKPEKITPGSIQVPDTYTKRQIDLSIARRTNDISQKVGVK